LTFPSPSVVNFAADEAVSVPLTTAQRLLWLGQKLAPDSPLYNMAFLFELNGEIDSAHFQTAFEALVVRCDALRLVIDEVDGVPSQRLLRQLDCTVSILDLSQSVEPYAEVQKWAEARSQERFNLSQKLFDTALIRLGPSRFVWYLNQHHLITDIEALRLVLQRMGALYECAVAGSLAEASAFLSYLSVAAGESPEVSKRSRKYWQTLLAEHEQPPVALYQRMKDRTSARTRRVSCELGPARTAALKELAMTSKAAALTPRMSLFNVVAGLLLAYLHAVSRQRAVGLLTPAHGRMTADVKETVGLFVELFPLLAEVGPSDTFDDLLGRVSESAGKLFRYAQPGASELAMSPNVNVVLNFIHSQFSDFAGIPVRSEWIHAGAGDPRHHLRLQVHDLDGQGSLQLHFDFNEDLFDRDLQDRAPSHFLALVDGAIADCQQAIAAVDLVGVKERSHLLSLGQSNRIEATPQTLVDLFEAQVGRTPGAIATTCQSQSLTYQQLNEQANQLAHYLKGQGVDAESPVGICLNRSTDMLVAILGVLKSGAAYVPVEPSHPAERIAYILADTRVGWVLTHSALSERINSGAKKLLLDKMSLTSQLSNNLEEDKPNAQQLAYLLYTSGSTGRPKGVAIEHGSVANYVQWAIGKYVRGRILSFPLFSPLAFDLTVTSVFVPLLSGGQVVIYPEGEDPIDLSLQRIFQENVVDVIKLTPSHLSLVQGLPIGSRVKTLILGGEDLKSDLAADIAANSENLLEIYNEYGPTEATVGCMIHQFDSADTAASMPIGRPAAGAEIYLLDESPSGRLQLTPEGGIGEIYIGGPGLARGYANRDALTAERFVVWEGRRLYRTGDLGRWRTDGALSYLGRGDRQVKIRGHRVELGEIEVAVAAHPQVRTCAVKVVQPAVGLMAGSTIEATPESLRYCTRCGLASNYPGIEFDLAGVCSVCRSYETYRHRTEEYFRTFEGLRAQLDAAKARKAGEYDCMMLLSGGKDSTYAIAQLVHLGYKVFAFTLDNGYISESAKENIRRVVQALGVDHTFATTPAMNEIFVDSLERHCNVCNGCFKTIYTLSMKLAYEMKIPAIVTGLSRGQFFETRLSEEWFTELFGQPEFNPDTIDETVLEARKIYHRSEDAVSSLMDVSVFQSDDIFDAVEIVDFYRYCDVELAEMLAFLRDRLPWIRPADTGRSTNCLINDAGIYVHKQQRGYHNYALPYSWDVRMGHKTVNECIDELNDEINVSEVKQMLKEIGYDLARSTESQLAAYYCVKESETISPESSRAEGLSPEGLSPEGLRSEGLRSEDLRAFLAQRLPGNLLPAYLIPLAQMPLSVNGKVDLAALPDAQESRPELRSAFVAPQTAIEKTLARLWQQVLKVNRIGIHDNFFDLGGDSIMAIQIAARLAESGFMLSPNQIFRAPTLAELAAVVVPEVVVAAEDLTGAVALSPIQQAFFSLEPLDPDQFTQTVLLDVDERLDFDALRACVRSLVTHHDSLRLSYAKEALGWTQRYQSSVPEGQTCYVDVTDSVDLDRAVEEEIARLQTQLNLADGDLVRAVLFELGERQQLGIVIHHLAVDAVSWQTLIKDLEMAYRQMKAKEEIVLPQKTSSFKAWVDGLAEAELAEESKYWEGVTDLAVGDGLTGRAVSHADSCTISRRLDESLTRDFLQDSYRDRPQEKLLAALTLALADQTDQSSFQVDLEGHGREEDLVPNARLVRTVGWFTSLFPVVFAAQEDAAETLRAVQRNLRSLPRSGIGYGILRYLQEGTVSENLRATPAAAILFNYLGEMEQLLPSQSMFRMVRPLQVSRSERQQRSHLIDISAYLIDGALRIDWDYGGIAGATVQSIADEMMQQLKLLIGAPTDAPTVEDFPLANLDGQKLDKLSALLGQLDDLDDDDMEDD